MSGNWLDVSSTSGNRFLSTYVKGFVDVSGGNVLLRAGPTNNNHLILQGGDISLNGRLNVATGTSVSVYKDFNGKVPPTNVYPSSGITPNTTAATSNTWVNSGVTWTASANTSGTFTTYNPFNNQTTDTSGGAGWATGNYYATTGGYFGSTTTSVNKNSTITSVSGDWLQIQSNIPLIMSSYTLTTAGYTGYSLMGRVPGAYTIAGSNDGNTWTALQDVSFTSLPSGFNLTTATSSPTTMQTTSSFLVSAATGNQNNANITTYTTQSNSYYYIRIIVIRTLGGSFSLPNAGNNVQFLWAPIFSPATQTGPSRALIYMDASNINQVDVSGSLGLINSNASSMTVTPTTGSFISYTWNNNNVTWFASSSSVYTAGTVSNVSYLAFDTNYYSTFASAAGTYTSGTGAYAGSISTPVSGQSAQTGEWLQLQSSIPLIMKSYQFVTGNVQGQLPKTYWIVGSNDGSTWYPIQSASAAAATTTATNTLVPGVITVNSTSTQTFGSTTISTTAYGTTTNSYTYFRLIGNTVTIGGTVMEIGGWFINFSPTTSSVSLALDNATPNQVNLGGSLSIGGALMSSSLQSSLTVNNMLGNQYTLDVNGAARAANLTKNISYIMSPGTGSIQWYLLGTYDSTTAPNTGASFILEVIGGGGYDNNSTNGSQSGGKATIYGRSLNNSNTTSSANVDITFKSEGGSPHVLSVVGVQVNAGTGTIARNQYYIYAQLAAYNQSVLNVETTTYSSFFTVNPTLNVSVTAPSTTNSLTVRVGTLISTTSGGYVGIGTTAPVYPLQVATTTTAQSNLSYYWISSSGTTGSGSVNTGTNIYASCHLAGRLLATEINLYSDSRIKTDIRDIDDNEALSILRLLKPKQFRYVDTVKNVNTPVYGFIAQEVKEVLDYSVGIHTDYIPNIYSKATITNGNTLQLDTKTTDSFIFDSSNNPIKIKLYNSTNNEITTTISNIIDDRTFEISDSQSVDNIFVYGQEVNDFHMLEKNAIFTITTSAVQQIDRELQEAKQTIQTLEARLAAMDARLSAAGF